MSRPEVEDRQETASVTLLSSLSLNQTGGELATREWNQTLDICEAS